MDIYTIVTFELACCVTTFTDLITSSHRDFAFLIKKSKFAQYLIDARNQILFIAPDERVFDQVFLELGIAAFLQCANAISSVVLQVRHLWLDGVTRTAAVQTGEREMIVQRQNLLNVVETLDVLVGFRVVEAAIDVLEHVHMRRYVRFPLVRVIGIVPKVHVTKIVRGSRVVGDRERFRHDGWRRPCL